jgi:3-hydroxyisobutyrate dehydrogenase
MSTAPPGPVGFIGLGNMGRPMAANLTRAGARLVVSDAHTTRQESFAAEFGVRAADGPEAFADAQTLVTMLPTGQVVREVLLDGGIAAALPRGAVVIDTSSSEPSRTIELGAALADLGISLVDAPVSGGMAKASDGTLAIMLGADDEAAAERAIPVLAAMSTRIFRTGALGTGHAMKALNNFVLAAGFEAAAEALVIGEKFGLDAAVLVDVLNASSGRNVSTETTLIDEVLSRRFAANFTLGLFAKDLRIAVDLANELEIEAPLCVLVHERLAQAGEELGRETDYSTIVTLWERRAGIELPVAALPYAPDSSDASDQ